MNLPPIFQFFGEHPFLTFFSFYLIVWLIDRMIKYFFYLIPAMLLDKINTFKYGHPKQPPIYITTEPRDVEKIDGRDH